MGRTKAIELLKNAVPAKALPDDEIGFFIEAVSMAIKSLEQAHFVSGNTLVVTLPEEDLKATNRVLLDCKPWAKIFYADSGKDTNVPSKWIPVSERLPESADCPMDCLVTRKSKTIGNYTDMAVAESDGTWTHEDWEAIVLGDNVSGKKTGLLNTRGDEIVAWMPLPEPWKGE